MSVVLKAEKREKVGSAEAKKIKRAGGLPAVVYSKSGNLNLNINAEEFEHEYDKGTSLTRIFEIELGGKKLKIIPHKIELDPVSDRPVHVDFLNCDEIDTMRAQPKLVFVNQDKSPGLKKGGFLHVVLRRAAVLCDAKNQVAVPDKIEIDAGSLHVGYKVRANDVKLPSGVRFVKKGNFLIASIIGRGKSEETPGSGAADGSSSAGGAASAAKAEGDKKAAEKKPEKK